MNIDQSAMFLASSIIVGLGIIALAIVLLVINNLFSKYWKPVIFSKYIFPAAIKDALGTAPPRFADTVEPTLDKVKK